MSQMPQQAALSKCPSCEEPLESGDRFCGACGYDLSVVPARPVDEPTLTMTGCPRRPRGRPLPTPAPEPRAPRPHHPRPPHRCRRRAPPRRAGPARPRAGRRPRAPGRSKPARRACKQRAGRRPVRTRRRPATGRRPVNRRPLAPGCRPALCGVRPAHPRPGDLRARRPADSPSRAPRASRSACPRGRARAARVRPDGPPGRPLHRRPLRPAGAAGGARPTARPGRRLHPSGPRSPCRRRGARAGRWAGARRLCGVPGRAGGRRRLLRELRPRPAARTGPHGTGMRPPRRGQRPRSAASPQRGRLRRRHDHPAGRLPVSVAVVCDGVSSATRPDEASLAASRAANASLLDALPRGTHPQQAMHEAIVAASEAVNALADEQPAEAREHAPQQNAPACTIVGAVVTAGLLVVGWVGDSRAYWIPVDRSAPGARLTEDDSWAAQMVAAGLMGEAEAYADHRAHAITGWLGADAYELEPHTAAFAGPPRCGRGLHGRPVELRGVRGRDGRGGARRRRRAPPARRPCAGRSRPRRRRPRQRNSGAGAVPGRPAGAGSA